MDMEKSGKLNATTATSAAKPFEGELTLADLKKVFGGKAVTGPITNGRFNPSSQKTRFNSVP